MKMINKEDYLGKDGKYHPQKFGLNKKARELLLNGELHRVSPMCCKVLKKKTVHKFEKESGLKAILGVRADEGTMRKARYKSCFTKDMKFTPIWDLKDELLEKIIKEYNIEVPNVYKYTKRTGCMGCPYGTYKHDTENELKLITNAQFNFVCEYFKESYKVLGIDIDKIRKERENKNEFKE